MTTELTSVSAKKLQVCACARCRMAKSLDAQDWAACIIATTAPPKSRQQSAEHGGRLRSQCMHAASRWFRSFLFSRARREHQTLQDQISPMGSSFSTRIAFWRRTGGSTNADCAVTDQPNPINATIHKRIPGHIIVYQLVPRLSKRREYADGARFDVYRLELQFTGPKIAHR